MRQQKPVTCFARISMGLLALVLTLVVFNAKGYTYVKANYSPIGFEPPEGKSNAPLEQYVVEGAGYFLNAYSDVLLLLNRVETADVQGIDYPGMQEILARAVSRMEMAKTAYTHLKETADITPYNPMVIETLISFDYDGFCEENHLIGSIFDEVKNYLAGGDIRGIYTQMLSDTENILLLLYSIQKEVDAQQMPKLKDFWKLNQWCSHSLLSGQYVSQIFYNILEN